MKKILEMQNKDNLDFDVQILSQEFQDFRLQALVKTIKTEQIHKTKLKMLLF